MFVDFNILNQLGSPAINSNTFANRPAAGQTGRLFVSIDTFEIYRDNGTTWDLIGGPGSSTITGTGTATQVAYFTSSQAIGSSANLFWDNANTRLGIGTATPGVALDVHSTGIMAHFNTTSATGNSYLAFQRTGTNVWRLGDQYNAGANFFQIHNTALSNNAVQIDAATNKTTWQAVQTYTTGLARANYFDYNLSVAAAGSFSSPNAITALGASLDLTLAGSATIPSGARSGLDAYNSIGFTGAGTLTHNQGAQIRAYSNLTAGWAFNGSATGTVTHLAGLRALFPDNTGSAINVTNNYALLLNDQTPNTGTVTYTNRWGVYQEGASDLNYFAANTLIGTTTNSGEKLVVNGSAAIGTTNAKLLIDTTNKIIQTTTGGNSKGIYCNFNGGDYFFGDATDLLGLSVNLTNNRFILGDVSYVYNGTNLYIDDVSQIIKTINNNADVGLYLDFVNNSFYLGLFGASPTNIVGFSYDNATGNVYYGDVQGYLTQQYFDVDLSNDLIKTVKSGVDKGLYLDFANNQYKFGDPINDFGFIVYDGANKSTYIGDYNYSYGGTSLRVEDHNGTITTFFAGNNDGINLDFVTESYKFGKIGVSYIEINQQASEVLLEIGGGGLNISNITTAGSAGSIAGYFEVIINGTNRKIPYYAV